MISKAMHFRLDLLVRSQTLLQDKKKTKTGNGTLGMKYQETWQQKTRRGKEDTLSAVLKLAALPNPLIR
jgi:hypothetical protein